MQLWYVHNPFNLHPPPTTYFSLPFSPPPPPPAPRNSIPLVAAEGQRQSTTGNLSLYKGSLVGADGNRPVYLLDLEGENGTLPKEMEQEATQFMVYFAPSPTLYLF